MGVTTRSSEWLCINCGFVLGNIFGGEYYPSIDGKHLHTSGPNLVATCPECGSIKTFYTADPVVRAVYQLVNAISAVSAKSMTEELARTVNRIIDNELVDAVEKRMKP